MSPTDCRKEFLEIFERIGRHHSRFEKFADFLELATCAIRKTTVPAGPEADALEVRYMNVVARYRANDIHAMPELLALTACLLVTQTSPRHAGWSEGPKRAGTDSRRQAAQRTRGLLPSDNACDPCHSRKSTFARAGHVQQPLA
jgi:hypothetical protein